MADIWLAAFRRHRVTEDEACEATILLGECPPLYRNHHLPALLKVIQQHRVPEPQRQVQDQLVRWRREAEVRSRMEVELQAEWDALTPERQEEIRANVCWENPGLARFEPFVRKMCLSYLNECRRSAG